MESDPFEQEVRDGHVFARGADDDKGQSMIQLKAFEYMVREGHLRHNVKFILEGGGGNRVSQSECFSAGAP